MPLYCLADVRQCHTQQAQLFTVIFQSPLHGRGTAEFHLIDTRNICQPRLDMLLGILLNQYRGGGGVQGEGHEGA